MKTHQKPICATRKRVVNANPRLRVGLVSLLKWVLAAWVLASVLFAHGCHGDEDHELYNVIIRVTGE